MTAKNKDQFVGAFVNAVLSKDGLVEVRNRDGKTLMTIFFNGKENSVFLVEELFKSTIHRSFDAMGRSTALRMMKRME